jgi:Lon protease-like protein
VPHRRLSLFPLELVLFPGAPLPLHIFEPRYRQMLHDCLQADRRFGIIFRPRDIAELDLEAGRIGCVAHVDETEMLPDGCSNIIVHGVRRFAFRRFAASETPYHVGEVTDYDDDEEPSVSLEAPATRVRELFERVGRAARLIADDADPIPSLPDDPAMLSFSVASYIDLEPPDRQRLLTSRSPSDRLEEVERILERALEPIELRASVHARSKTNGHGPGVEGSG